MKYSLWCFIISYFVLPYLTVNKSRSVHDCVLCTYENGSAFCFVFHVLFCLKEAAHIILLNLRTKAKACIIYFLSYYTYYVVFDLI
jgi:hypothetical protein